MRVMWPREHGATMEVTFPLLSAWVLGAPRVASFALGAAAALAFLAHEPLMLLLGKRGARRRREEGRSAVRQVFSLGILATAAGGLGLAAASPMVRWLMLAPVSLGAGALLLALAGKERSLVGELHVASTLSSVALPVATAAGLSVATSLTLVGVWIVGFSVGTFAARGVLLRNRDAGRGLRRATRLALFVAACCVAVAAAGLLSAPFALAPLPFVVVAFGLRARPPAPQRMTTIGLTLVGASTITLITLVLGVARAPMG